MPQMQEKFKIHIKNTFYNILDRQLLKALIIPSTDAKYICRFK